MFSLNNPSSFLNKTKQEFLTENIIIFQLPLFQHTVDEVRKQVRTSQINLRSRSAAGPDLLMIIIKACLEATFELTA